MSGSSSTSAGSMLLRRLPHKDKRALKALAVALPLFFAWALHRLRQAFLRRRSQCFLSLSSPLQGSVVKQAAPYWRQAHWFWGPDCWRGFCPNCKRPLDATLCEESWPVPSPRDERRCAFLICLWGASPNYLVGAMVLGASLRKTGSPHARVCLHTEDVPAAHIELLSLIWDCRLVRHVDACVRELSFSEKEDRFEKVFTKLRGLELVEFRKVLMMDIDLLVRGNVDELFELPAPAAMRRGMNDRFPYRTGDCIEGRSFFLGKDQSKWSWGQGTGINAGVMLWEPSRAVFEQMTSEITEPEHPGHCKGNGPEQDFLSRYWADAPWRHIGVEYNFQLHQMFFALHPDRAARAERVRLAGEPEKIKIVHFSGESTAKPWHRVLDERWAEYWPARHRDAEYLQLFADEFLGHWLWVKKDAASFATSASNPKNWDMGGMFLDGEGRICRKDRWDREERLELPEECVENVMSFLATALREWFDTLQELEEELGFQLRDRLLLDSPGSRPQEGCTGGTEPPAASKALGWHRHGGRGGWWVEEEDEDLALPFLGESGASEGPQKATVMASVSSSGLLVSFLEKGACSLEEQDRGGVFVKVVGRHSPRHVRLPEGGSEEELQQALTPLQLWVGGVPAGAGVLLAMVDLEPRALEAALAALAPLGLPQTPPPKGCRALAAAGRAGARGAKEDAFATHASRDVAYASAMLADS